MVGMLGCSTSRPSSTCRTSCSRAGHARHDLSSSCSGRRRSSSPTSSRSRCCSAALVTIGLLTKNSELIVMRACGISLYRTALPLVVVRAAAPARCCSRIEERVLAAANRRAERLKHIIRTGIAADLRRAQPQVDRRRRRRDLSLPVLRPAQARAERPRRSSSSIRRRTRSSRARSCRGDLRSATASRRRRCRSGRSSAAGSASSIRDAGRARFTPFDNSRRRSSPPTIS